MGLAVLAALELLVWMATSADMDRHEGRGGLSRTKQPKGSTTEGTSLCGGGKSVSGTGISSDTHIRTLATHRFYYSFHTHTYFIWTSSQSFCTSILTETARLSAGKSNHPIANRRAHAFRHMQFISETVKRKDRSRDRENKDHERTIINLILNI